MLSLKPAWGLTCLGGGWDILTRKQVKFEKHPQKDSMKENIEETTMCIFFTLSKWRSSAADSY